MILVTNHDWQKENVLIPDNVIVLNTLSSEFESIVSEMDATCEFSQIAK